MLLIILDSLVKLTRAGANLSATFRRSCISRLKSCECGAITSKKEVSSVTGYDYSESATLKISIIEAKENLTKYLEMAQRGVEVTISVNGVPACRIVGIDQAIIKRFGLLRGKATIPDDFDHQDQDILELFYGDGDR